MNNVYFQKLALERAQHHLAQLCAILVHMQPEGQGQDLSLELIGRIGQDLSAIEQDMRNNFS